MYEQHASLMAKYPRQCGSDGLTDNCEEFHTKRSFSLRAKCVCASCDESQTHFDTKNNWAPLPLQVGVNQKKKRDAIDAALKEIEWRRWIQSAKAYSEPARSEISVRFQILDLNHSKGSDSAGQKEDALIVFRKMSSFF